MKKYKIELVEELSRFIEVEAQSLDNAFEQVEEMYCNADIMLDYSDAQAAKLAYYDKEYVEYIIY